MLKDGFQVMKMSNVRNIYFSDEAFTTLEKIELFDSNDKKLSRSNVINKLILDKLKVVRTREEQELIFVKKKYWLSFYLLLCNSSYFHLKFVPSLVFILLFTEKKSYC